MTELNQKVYVRITGRWQKFFDVDRLRIVSLGFCVEIGNLERSAMSQLRLAVDI
jgi:hypothetical protein